MKVLAVVVTYNRLSLLKEAIYALKKQSRLAEALLVVNNGSTDGTTDWLESQSGFTVIHQENTGGSGGFYTGLKYAAAKGYDWVWVMDDDTICLDNSLEKLIEKSAITNRIGFIGSKCVWQDGNPHLMNLPAISSSFNKSLPFNQYDNEKVLLVETCSFVSLLINVRAIKDVGLPYKEFFIWGDDQEYTRRIIKAGYLGFYCPDSVVIHKTPENYFPDFYRDVAKNLWKHKYGFRNEFFMVKKNRGALYFGVWLLIKLVYTSAKILIIRSSDRVRFIGTLWGAGIKSVFFNPKIDRA